MKQIILLLLIAFSPLWATILPARVPAIICTPIVESPHEIELDSQIVDIDILNHIDSFLVDVRITIHVTNKESSESEVDISLYSLWANDISISTNSSSFNSTTEEVSATVLDSLFSSTYEIEYYNDIRSKKLSANKTTCKLVLKNEDTISINTTLDLRYMVAGMWSRSSINYLHNTSTKSQLNESQFKILSPKKSQWKESGSAVVHITVPEDVLIDDERIKKGEINSDTSLTFDDASKMDLYYTVLKDYRCLKPGGPIFAIGGSKRYGFVLQAGWEFGYDFTEKFALLLREGYDTNTKNHKALSNEMVFQIYKVFSISEGILINFKENQQIWRTGLELRTPMGGYKFDVDYNLDNKMTSTRFMFIIGF